MKGHREFFEVMEMNSCDSHCGDSYCLHLVKSTQLYTKKSKLYCILLIPVFLKAKTLNMKL